MMRQTPESRKISQSKYNRSPKGRAASARYRSTEKGKATDRKHDLKQRSTPKRKLYLYTREQLPEVKAKRTTYRQLPENKDAKYVKSLERFYKMTKEDYEELLKKQKGLCAICKTNPGVRLSVDHDHKTGRVRGLLCRKCNLGIGFLKDSVDFLRNAIDYLL